MSTRVDLSRRRVLVAGAGAAVGALGAFPVVTMAADDALATRPIPHSGERIPIVGIGTAVIFDFEDDAAKYGERREVIRTLVAGGGRLIDTAAGYGKAEDRVGDLVSDLGVRDKLFLATKYSFALDRAAANASLQASLKRLKTNRIDLMQAWNVTDPNFEFGVLREWKQQGLCRYVGMTTSQLRAYDAISKVLAREKPELFRANN